uniref:Alpha/beta hydrolase fold-3 domain-containing protein n=1 Tax=Calidris pygmaea TaxID=425635 RepID=A0A8C3JCI4_9CHAR
MESFYALASIAGILVAFVLLVLIATSHNSFKVEIPPDADQPSKLRLYHYVYTLLEEHVLIRLIFDGLPVCRDSQLCIKDLHFDEVPVRIYLPRAPPAGKRRGVIFFHGGCGMFGTLNVYFYFLNSLICPYLVSKLFFIGYSILYAQTLECLMATEHFLKTSENYGVDPARIIACGDSAGGTFAATVCQELVNRTDIPKIRAQVLVYPFLQALNFNLPSHQKNAFTAFLSRERTVCYMLKYLNKDCSLKEAVLAGSHVPESMNLKYRKWINPDLIPEIFKLGYKPPLPTSFLPEVHEETKELLKTRLSPLLAEDAVVCRLPDTCIITCQHDVLRDDGLLYKKRLEDNNVKVSWYHMDDGFHCALGFFGYGIFSFPSSSKIMNYTVNFIKENTSIN